MQTTPTQLVERFVRPARLTGSVAVPGDKSLSHRALLFAALATGPSELQGLSGGEDVVGTARALQQLGVDLDLGAGRCVVHGRGPASWRSPQGPIDCGNSGTTMRLLCGLLASLPGIQATLTGDPSLQRRPMARVTLPLVAMGAHITAADGRAPLQIVGQHLQGQPHHLPVASAQLKTALLLAGLHASGQTEVYEPIQSRDHTERMLSALGAPLVPLDGGWAIAAGTIRPLGTWQAPGDPSSAAFVVVAGVLHPNAQVAVPTVCVNPTRIGWVDVLARMGAAVSASDNEESAGEPIATLHARSSTLVATAIEPAEVPALIDELPILALCAAAASGTSVWRGIAELRVKESDRLAAIVRLLTLLGVTTRHGPDWLEIDGLGSLQAVAALRAPFAPGLDHRMAMTAAVAGLCGPHPLQVSGMEAVASSWPGFVAALAQISRTDL